MPDHLPRATERTPVPPSAALILEETAVPDDDTTPDHVDEVATAELLTAELLELDADPSRPIGRTAVQAAVPAALVTIGTWWAVDLASLDLNGAAPGTEMPTEVTAAFITLATVAMAVLMNRRRRPSGEA